MDKTRSGLYTKLRENGHEMDMHIAHEEGKGGGGGRTVPIPDMAILYLDGRFTCTRGPCAGPQTDGCGATYEMSAATPLRPTGHAGCPRMLTRDRMPGRTRLARGRGGPAVRQRLRKSAATKHVRSTQLAHTRSHRNMGLRRPSILLTSQPYELRSYTI